MFGSKFFDRSISVLAFVTVLLATLLLTARGLNFAVEFTGGITIQMHYPEAPGSKSVQDSLVRAGLADASVKEFNGNFFITMPTREDDLTPELTQRIVKQVIAALGTEQRHMEVSNVEVITPEGRPGSSIARSRAWSGPPDPRVRCNYDPSSGSLRLAFCALDWCDQCSQHGCLPRAFPVRLHGF
jgi:preprotein translocase subunit SecF